MTLGSGAMTNPIEDITKNADLIMLVGSNPEAVSYTHLGADDYITKPFNILEVKVRIKAIMRRAGSDHEEKEKAKSIQVGDLRMDCEGRRVFIAGKEINQMCIRDRTMAYRAF